MPVPKKFDRGQAIDLKLKGRSYAQIGQELGVAPQTVHHGIAPILKQLADPETVGYYRKEQAQILDGLAARTVAHITDDKLVNSSAKDLGILTAVLIDKSRLIQGQSTSNSSIMLRAVMDTLKVEEAAEDNVAEPVDNS